MTKVVGNRACRRSGWGGGGIGVSHGAGDFLGEIEMDILQRLGWTDSDVRGASDISGGSHWACRRICLDLDLVN